MAPLAALRIPIWMEGRAVLEHAALRRDGVLRGEGVPRGDGAPVLLVPGFLAGDTTLGVMARWLRRIGHAPTRATIRANVDCSARTLERLEARAEAAAERHGRRVRVVGHSRGGTLARVLAVRRPDLVETIVALGSPVTDQFAAHPLVLAQVRAVALLGSAGVPGLFRRGCQDGCCAGAHAELQGAFPAGVRYVSVYSRTDGVVDWRCCLDSAAEHVEVRSSHLGMAASAEVFRVLAGVLAPAPAAAARAAA
jgi:triacylglycerol lipase